MERLGALAHFYVSFSLGTVKKANRSTSSSRRCFKRLPPVTVPPKAWL
ncbi:hypothetical protein EWM64_g7251 [Hericium alpestre]|uniref:Uncharacterized protein n=1 Tax=Hericium alpestre TaxID=135208 RepID=A0A4Y9ZRU2_9AGAM|nr:hypothetical protein EWM64_g7251 [Hericium alpestre]